MLRFASRLVNAPGVSKTMATKTTTTVQLQRLSSAASTSLPRSPFAYGSRDFKEIRSEQQFFVDNTRFIPLLESGYQHFFVRPPRFGKSLFVNALHRYYDCATSQNEFDELFGGLDAHTNVTPLVRSFHVLKLDLSIGVEGEVNKNFTNKVNQALVAFRTHYNLEFEINETDCHDSLKAAAAEVKDIGGKLYVLIDEYDRFANQLLVDNIDAYRVGQSGVSVLRSFLQTLKAIGGNGMRSFITGIMPLALADSSGYNVARNLTDSPRFASLVGFRERDLERGLALIPHLNTAQREGALALMRKYYNGYWFAGATEPLYNSTQALYFLKRLSMGDVDVDELLAMDAASHPALLARLTDTNVHVSNSIVKLARSVPEGERAVAQLLGKSVPLERGLERVITLESLVSQPTAEALQALLFYQGIATFTDAQGSSLCLPNELIRQKQFAPLHGTLQFRDINVLLRAPTTALFEALFADIAKLGPGAVQKESTFAFRVGLVLSKLCRIADIRLEVRAGRTRCDVLLVCKDGALLLELKCVPLESLMLGGQQLSELTDEQVFLLPTTAQSSHMPASGKSEVVRKVAHIVLAAQEQVAEQAASLRATGRVGAATPLHAWVAVLVGDRVIVRAEADRVVPDKSKRARKSATN
jgi:hypothetical protein